MPEPVLIAIAAALAGKSMGNLYDLVRSKFAARKPALDALQAAENQPPTSPQVHALATELAHATATDPTFAAALHQTWTATTTTNTVTNNISGTIQGPTIQAQNIEGKITFK